MDIDVVMRLTQSVVQTVFTICDIELPSVPRTCDDLAVQHPFSKWTTGVGANAIQYVKCSVDVVDGKYTSVGHDFGSAAGSDVIA